MRIFFVLAVAIAGACSAHAQPVQDRYGPPRPAPRPPLVLASLDSVRPSRVSPPPATARLLNWSTRRGVEQPTPPAQAIATPPAQPIVTPPPRPTPPAPAARLPESLYARPAPVVAAAPVIATPAAQTLAALAAPTTPAPRAAQPPGGSTRFYSLHREYGLAPDHAPEQSRQPRYVLIGPPDPARPTDNDDSPPKAPKAVGAF